MSFERDKASESDLEGIHQYPFSFPSRLVSSHSLMVTVFLEMLVSAPSAPSSTLCAMMLHNVMAQRLCKIGLERNPSPTGKRYFPTVSQLGHFPMNCFQRISNLSTSKSYKSVWHNDGVLYQTVPVRHPSMTVYQPVHTGSSYMYIKQNNQVHRLHTCTSNDARDTTAKGLRGEYGANKIRETRWHNTKGRNIKFYVLMKSMNTIQRYCNVTVLTTLLPFAELSHLVMAMP